jgi:hypothetical protein
MGSPRRRIAVLAVAVVAPTLSGAGLFHETRAARLAVSPLEWISRDIVQDHDDQELRRPYISGEGEAVLFSDVIEQGDGDDFLRSYVSDRENGDTEDTLGEVAIPTATATVLARDGCHVAARIYQADSQRWAVYTWDRCVATPVASEVIGLADDSLSQIEQRLLAISADGQYVAGWRTDDDEDDGDETEWNLRVADATTDTFAEIRTLFENPEGLTTLQPMALDLSDDGRVLAAVMTGDNGAPDNYLYRWSRQSASPLTFSAEQFVVEVGDCQDDDVCAVSLSRNGRFTAFPEKRVTAADDIEYFEVVVHDAATGGFARVSMPGEGDVTDPDISPDGSLMALTVWPEKELIPGNTVPSGLVGTPQVYVASSTPGFGTAVDVDLVSANNAGVALENGAYEGRISTTGRFVTFVADAAEETGNIPPTTSSPNTGSTPPATGRLDVWLRERAPTMTITPSVDFGLLDVGNTSGVQTLTVTNTSKVLIRDLVVGAPAAPFSIVDDDCTGVTLRPANVCTIDVQFAPTDPVSSFDDVTVTGEDVTVVSRLVGTGRVDTTTSSSTTTTVPETTTTSTTTTTTTTATTAPPTTTTIPPGPGILVATPLLDFGQVVVGTVGGPQTATITNAGGSPVVVTGAVISGADATSFVIGANSCIGLTLAPATACTVTISATPSRGGPATGTLTVTSGGGLSTSTQLAVSGFFTPTLRVSPGVLRGGQGAQAVGFGFPPNTIVEFAYEGEASFGSALSDATGKVTFAFIVFRNDPRIGGQVMTAVDQVDQFGGVRATFLIVLASMTPTADVVTQSHALIVRNG